MSTWRRLSRKRRASYLAIAVFILATTGWASSQWASQWEEVASISPVADAETKAERLEAPVPPPQEVFIQRRSNADGLGNVVVTVQLSPEQVQAKRDEGTADFLTIGTPEALVILRDDGVNEDLVAGDGVFSAFATVDEAELQQRSSNDAAALDSNATAVVPVFEGRGAVGVERPPAFDFASFDGGKAVPVDPAVVFLEPESTTTTTGGTVPVSEAIRSKAVTAKISSTTPVIPGTNRFQERVLIIRSLGVVTDPVRTWDPCTGNGNVNGVWTFNHLMTQMANPAASGIDPADFVDQWLLNWLNGALTINGDPVPSRAQMSAIRTFWPKRPDGKLDLTRSPLRLLAILPRLDLRRTTGGGGAYSVNTSGNFLDAGEARFIFGFVVPPGVSTAGFISPAPIPGTNGCNALPFTAIFEFRIAKCDCLDVKSWAQQWVALASFGPGTAAYNSRLEKITEQFVRANANPRNPNGSSLGQLRTNEVTLNAPWELREFQLTQFPFTFLQETTVEDTIRNHATNDYNNNANGSGLLRDWIVNIVKASLPPFEGAIPPVPLIFRGATFMAGDSRTVETGNPDFVTFHWNEPSLNINVTANPADLNIRRENWARHRVSRAACNGCHRRETFTQFVHVDPDDSMIDPIASPWDDTLNGGLGGWTAPIVRSNPALPAEISQFLSGINNLGDPADALANGAADARSPNRGNPKRHFDDLARREKDIRGVASMFCGRFHPVHVAHVRDTLKKTGKLPPNLFEGITILPVDHRVSVSVDDMKRNFVGEPH